MCSVTQQRQTPVDPRRQDGHVEQFPHLQAVRVGLFEQRQHGLVKVAIHVQHLGQLALGVPVAARVRLGLGVDIDKVEQLVVGDWVHDDAPVGTVPDE